MERWTIGEAAARFGLRPSALRYYEELGLIEPVDRSGQVRRYDRVQLRRLAFVRIAKDLGLPLRATAAFMDAADDRRRELVDEQLARLDAQAARIRRAQDVLRHARVCPIPHPLTRCPDLIAELDRAVDGPI